MVAVVSLRRSCIRIATAVVAICGVARARADETVAASQPSSQPVIESWRIGTFSSPSVEPATTRPAETQPASQPAESPAPQFSAPLLQIDELAFDLGFDGTWSHIQTNSFPTWPYRTFKQTDKYQTYEETVGFQSEGSIVNERVMRYHASVRGGLSQESQIETGPGFHYREFPHGQALEYDLRAMMLPAGKISANVSASQLHDRVPQQFLPSLDRYREQYGAELLYNDAVLPMRLYFEDSNELLTNNDPFQPDDEQFDQRHLEYDATWQPDEFRRIQLSYEYDDRRETYSGTPDQYDTFGNYLTLNQSLQFGLDHRSRLDTVVRVQDEAGAFARDIYELAPQLRLQHTDALATLYRAQWLRESYEGLSVDVLRGDAGINHQVDNWLDSNLSGYGLTESAELGADMTESGAIWTESFNRDNALGRLSASSTFNYAFQQIDGGDQQGVVVGESGTFNDPLPIYLVQTDVRRSSIVVINASTREIYLAGRDYVVAQVGRYTTLGRLRTGKIANLQTVLISYVYEFAQDARINRYRWDARVQQSFKSGWVPYYATTLQHEDVSTTQFYGYLPNQINRQRLGVDYRRPRWSAGTEFEYYHNDIDPYTAGHFRGNVTILNESPHWLAGRSTYSYFRFNSVDELQAHDTSMLDLGLSYRARLGRDLEINATAAYLYEYDTIFGPTNGVDASASLNWRIGLFTAIFEVEYDQLNLPTSGERGLSFWVKLRRDIPVTSGGRMQ